jgi:hypothetical protein
MSTHPMVSSSRRTGTRPKRLWDLNSSIIVEWECRALWPYICWTLSSSLAGPAPLPFRDAVPPFETAHRCLDHCSTALGADDTTTQAQ